MRTIVLQPGEEIRVETALGALEILSTPFEKSGFSIVKIPDCRSEDYSTEFVEVSNG